MDAIPIVQLNMDGFQKPILFEKKSKSGSKKKSKRRDRSPPVVPVVFATEEMPEDATLSASEDEKVDKKKGSVYPKPTVSTRGILDQETSALHSVDLSIPVGEDEHLPRAQPYMKPEEVRRHEDELAQRRRLEALQKKDKKGKKEKKDKKESKKSKGSKKDTAAKGDDKKKKSSSKKSDAKEEALIMLEPPAVAKSPSPSPSPSPTPVRPRSVEPVVEAPVKKEKKEKKDKKESDKGTKPKKESASKKSKAPVIVPFPERSDIELGLNESVALVRVVVCSSLVLQSRVQWS